MKLFLDILRRRRWALAIVLAAGSLAAVYGAARVEFEDNFRQVFKSPNRLYAQLDQFAGEFGAGDTLCVILIEAPDVFARPVLQSIHRIHTQSQQLEGVDSAVSLFSARGERRVGRYLLPLLADPDLPDERLAELRPKIVAHPVLQGRLISSDEKATLVVVRLEKRLQTVEALEPVLNRIHGVVDHNIADSGAVAHITGIPSIRVESVKRLQRDSVWITGAGALMATLVAWLLLRRAAAVFIVVFPPMVGVLWTVGALGWAGKDFDVINVVLPVLVLAIGVTDSVHLMLDFRRGLSAGQDTVAAALDTIRHLTRACFLTSLTTAIGFGSLVVSSDQVIRNFAVFAAAGVCLNFVVVITMFPLLAMTRLGRSCGAGASADISDGGWNRACGWIVQRPRRLAGLSVAATLLALYFATYLRTDYQLLENHSPRSASRRALRRCERHFGGLPTLHVVVEWPAAETSAEGVLALIDEIHAILDAAPAASSPLSIRTVVDSLPGASDEERWRSLRFIPDEDLKRIFNIEQRKAVVSANAPDAGAAALREPLREIEARLQDAARKYPGYSLHVTGYAYVTTFRTSSMIRSLVYSLAAATLVILVVIVAAFRSPALGLISLIPNAFPLLATAALMACLQFPLQYASVLSFSICLGVAVDDTIHFLARFCREMQEDGQVEASVRRTYAAITPALLTTTILMLTGFAAGFVSTMPTMHAFALYSCTALGFALLGDLLILPALLVCFGRFQQPPDDSITTTG